MRVALPLLALAVCAGANQPAPPQPSARQVVDRSGTVWEPAWDQAGRQYFVDRATGRTSWQIDAAQGAPAPPARPQAHSVSRLRPSTAPQQPAKQLMLYCNKSICIVFSIVKWSAKF